MQILFTTLSQMAVLFLLIICGFVLMKLKVLPKNSATVLAKLENNLFLPALVLSTFSQSFTTEKLKTTWQLFLISFVITLVMMAAAIGVSFLCAKDRYTRNIYTYGLSFSNFGFMGNAVVSAVFPDIFVEYMVFVLPLWCMIYLWGVPTLLMPVDTNGSNRILKRLKAFVNPMFIAMIIGIIIGLSGIKLPGFLSSVISTAGSCMSPIAMLLTGVTIAAMSFKKVLSQKSVYAVSIVRLIVFPLLAIGVFYFIPASRELTVCTVCSLAMPLGLNTIVIPSAYGKDVTAPAGMAIVSHLLACITIPVIFYLMMKLPM